MGPTWIQHGSRTDPASDPPLGQFFFIRADELRKYHKSDQFQPHMPRLQDLLLERPGWMVRKQLSFRGVCFGEYSADYVAVSHRLGSTIRVGWHRRGSRAGSHIGIHATDLE